LEQAAARCGAALHQRAGSGGIPRRSLGPHVSPRPICGIRPAECGAKLWQGRRFCAKCSGVLVVGPAKRPINRHGASHRRTFHRRPPDAHDAKCRASHTAQPPDPKTGNCREPWEASPTFGVAPEATSDPALHPHEVVACLPTRVPRQIRLPSASGAAKKPETVAHCRLSDFGSSRSDVPFREGAGRAIYGAASKSSDAGGDAGRA